MQKLWVQKYLQFYAENLCILICGRSRNYTIEMTGNQNFIYTTIKPVLKLHSL